MNVCVAFQNGPAAGGSTIIEDARVGQDIEVTTIDLAADEIGDTLSNPFDDDPVPTITTTYTVVQRVGQAGIARVAWS